MMQGSKEFSEYFSDFNSCMKAEKNTRISEFEAVTVNPRIGALPRISASLPSPYFVEEQ